jgi:hypothetical protein
VSHVSQFWRLSCRKSGVACVNFVPSKPLNAPAKESKDILISFFAKTAAEQRMCASNSA